MAVAHKSAISVGLIYVPVSLYKTTRNTAISFNQLCKDENGKYQRIKYQKLCPSCNSEVKSSDILKESNQKLIKLFMYYILLK